MTAGYRQKVKAELLDTLSLKSQTSVFFDGEASREALLIDNTSEKALIWGPFDNQMTVELTFYNISSSGHGWTISIIEADKIAEVKGFSYQPRYLLMFRQLLANNLKTAMTVVRKITKF
jgi:extracellular elastinolytic metalloproteinase